jgi:hypothetical protein
MSIDRTHSVEGLTSSSKDLEDVEDPEVYKRSLPTVVDLSSLDDDSVGRQVDSPRECCSTAQDLRRRISAGRD